MSQTQTGTTSEGTPADAPYRYTQQLANEIELRWQDRWEKEQTFRAPNPVGPLAEPDHPAAGHEKLFIMDMFPYPSGAGLHVGHPLGYIATDVFARFHRMCGRNVMHTMGYDAFGLPAEQHAVQTGQHPRATTESNIVRYRAQLRRLGQGYDTRRSFATIDPDYMRWTQWIFLQIFNSWFDVDAGKARPIDELVKEFESAERATPDGRPWTELSGVEQRKVIDGYRLAYVDEVPVNWCPGLGTVLANEEVTSEGRSERGNYPVFQRTLKQWMMRITAYSDRLIDDLDRIDWPDKVKTMQRNWIGRSSGANIRFGTSAGDLEVFTTRPDTIFGTTFMVIAPEHPMVDDLTAPGWPESTKVVWTGGHASPSEAVQAYRTQAAARTEVERQTEGRDKTGVFTGSYATNPVNGEQIPVFVADYVLMRYGTGSIMAVPGQDERDWEYAERFDLPIVRTVRPPDDFEGEAFLGEGPAINSASDAISLNGLGIDDAKAKIIEWLETGGHGQGTTTYRLRDWLFSRQRYWGEPFPIVYDEHDMPIALPDDQLPVLLPDVPDYSPKTYAEDDVTSMPEPPLARVPEWVNVELDLGGGSGFGGEGIGGGSGFGGEDGGGEDGGGERGVKTYRRETNTMPNWAGSCWYHLRYIDPTNDQQVVDPDNERYWMGPNPGRGGPDDPGGVDLYVGGVEHAVLHLLYARFWHKVLFDLGHVTSDEPYYRLFNQGYIQAFAYTDSRGQYVPAEEVEEVAPSEFQWHGQKVNQEYGKIGKSLKNVVSPDDMYAEFGADTFRVYEMSMGPLDQSKPWETRAVVGAQRFLQRVWRNVVSESTGEPTVTDQPADEETRRVLHRTIDSVRTEMSAMRFNTAIARLTELNNHLTKLDSVPREAAEPLVQMVAPLAPHIGEELWAKLGHDESLTYEPFPVADPSLLVDDLVTCVVQVAGKVRDRLQVPPSVDEDTLRELALKSEAVQRVLDGRDVRKVIVRAPKLVNVVPA